MKIKGITIELGVNSKPVTDAFQKINKEISSTNKTLKDINKELKLDPTNTELLEQKAKYLNKAIEETNKKLDEEKKILKELETLDGGSGKYAEQIEVMKREIVDTEAKLKSFKEQWREFGSVVKQELTAVGNKLKDVGSKITNIGSQMTTRVTAPIVAGFGLALDSASDYEENLNKLNVAFGEYADQVREFTDNAQIDFGLSMKDASESASAFGALAKGIGLSEKEASQMSVELTKLSADLGSYFNTDIATSAGALEAIFTGNAKALRQFGVVMTDNSLKEYAESLGIVYKDLTEIEKVQLRYNFVLQQTQDAQGDFARTNDGTANAMKSLKASVSDLLTVIGEELIPIITPLIQQVAEFISKLTQTDSETLKIIVTIGLVLAAIGPVLVVLGTIIQLVGGLITGIGALFSPLGLIVLAIGAVVTAGVALYQNWETIKEKAIEIWDSVMAKFEAVKEFFREKIDWLIGKFNQLRDAISNAFSKYVSGIGAKLGFGSVGFNSGGFASGGFNSGGYASNGYNLSTNVTINNYSQPITSAMADSIVDRVNAQLGAMLR